MQKEVTTTREIEAREIPSGTKLTIPEGTPLAITQSLGGAYTVITHDIMSARRVAEFIYVLRKGRIVQSGPAEELFKSDNAFVRQFLSGESQGPLGME